MSPVTITMYSDYVCPFCYLGRQALDTYRDRRDAELAIDWRPFDLRSHKRGPDGEIDTSIPDGKNEAYFEQVRENVARLQTRYDVEEMVALEELPDQVDSFPAQVASYTVKQTSPDRWPALDEGIFEALWVSSLDIGDPDVLVEIAEESDLDGASLRAAVADESRCEAVTRVFETARTDGITAVPTFVYGEHTARGAVPPAQLERLVEGG